MDSDEQCISRKRRRETETDPGCSAITEIFSNVGHIDFILARSGEHYREVNETLSYESNNTGKMYLNLAGFALSMIQIAMRQVRQNSFLQVNKSCKTSRKKTDAKVVFGQPEDQDNEQRSYLEDSDCIELAEKASTVLEDLYAIFCEEKFDRDLGFTEYAMAIIRIGEKLIGKSRSLETSVSNAFGEKFGSELWLDFNLQKLNITPEKHS